MKRAITLGIGALALAGMTLPTSAADLGARPITKAPVAAPVVAYNWTGCYIGANGGGKAGKFSGNTTILPATLVTRWFIVGRGRALGIACTPFVIALIPLASSWMLHKFGLTVTYWMLAALSAIGSGLVAVTITGASLVPVMVITRGWVPTVVLPSLTWA